MGSPALPLAPPALPVAPSVPVVGSTSDMFADLPSDLLAGIDDISPTGVEDIPEDPPVEEPLTEAPDDTPSGADIIEPEPIAAAPEEVKPGEVKPAAAEEEELPEGVRKGKDNKGKDKYFLEEGRYKTFHGNHQLVQQAGEIIGEPLTAESLKLRNDALIAQERLFNSLASGDPTEQHEVVKFMLDEMKSAHTNGETGVDPIVPFADTVYDNLKASSSEGYQQLYKRTAVDLLTNLFSAGATSDNKELYYAAQQISMDLAKVGPRPEGVSNEDWERYVTEKTAAEGFPFHLIQDAPSVAAKTDPLADAHRRIAELESKVNGRTHETAAEQYQSWRTRNIEDVRTAIVNDAVKPKLAAIQEGWKDHPDDWQRLVIDPLNREVVKNVQADSDFNKRIEDLTRQAQRATSEQVRQTLGKQIKDLYVHRASLAVDKVKKPIVDFAANWLKGRSDQTHERRAGAQTRTTPKGAAAPVQRSPIPDNLGMKDNVFDSATAARQADLLIAGLR